MAVYKLNEAYSEKLPSWLLKGLGLLGRGHRYTADRMTKQGINLADASYVPQPKPTSGHASLYKDPNILPVYLLDTSTKWRNDTGVYIPGVNDAESIYIDGEYWHYGQLSRKALLDRTIEFGLIYLNDPDSKDPREIQRQRKSARVGVDDRRANAQYKRPVYKNTTPEGRTDWENPSGYEWVTKPGYDKSGYKLDPEKYVRQLNEAGLDNYSVKLKRYYNMIVKAQQDAAKWITNIDPDTEDRTEIRDFAGYLDRAIYYYRQLTKEVNRLVKDIESGDFPESRADDYLRNWMGNYGKQIYDYIKEFNKYIGR